MILVLRSGKSGTEKLEVTKESLKLPFLHLSGEGWTRDRPETGRRGRESLALDQLRGPGAYCLISLCLAFLSP